MIRQPFEDVSIMILKLGFSNGHVSFQGCISFGKGRIFTLKFQHFCMIAPWDSQKKRTQKTASFVKGRSTLKFPALFYDCSVRFRKKKKTSVIPKKSAQGRRSHHQIWASFLSHGGSRDLPILFGEKNCPISFIPRTQTTSIQPPLSVLALGCWFCWGLVGTYHFGGSCEDKTFDKLWRREMTWHTWYVS